MIDENNEYSKYNNVDDISKFLNNNEDGKVMMNNDEIKIETKTKKYFSMSDTEDYKSTCRSIVSMLREFESETDQNSIIQDVINTLIKEREAILSRALKEVYIMQETLKNLKEIKL